MGSVERYFQCKTFDSFLFSFFFKSKHTQILRSVDREGLHLAPIERALDTEGPNIPDHELTSSQWVQTTASRIASCIEAQKLETYVHCSKHRRLLSPRVISNPVSHCISQPWPRRRKLARLKSYSERELVPD